MWNKPFGLLAPVHEAALRGVDLATPQRMAEYFLLPSIAVWIQAMLLVQQGARGTKRQEGSNRVLRLGMGVIALSLMARSYFSYRFTGESRVCAVCGTRGASASDAIVSTQTLRHPRALPSPTTFIS